MNCLPCFGNKNSESKEQEELPVAQPKAIPSQSPVNNVASPSRPDTQDNNQKQDRVTATPAAANTDEAMDNSTHTFTFRELALATKNFRRESLLGESRVGKVYKGTLQGSGQVVAVKQLDKQGTKANKEFLVEVMMLSLLHHPNLVDLIGYCADGDQRILVYEYMSRGSLNDHLSEAPPESKPLDWLTRMKIASGTAQALEYLHEKANPPVLYRNLKSTNILLDENFEPKLTDYGLAKLEIDSGNTMHQRVLSTVLCAPEYEQNGEVTPKSDVYSFGIVLLELITGRKALDTSRPADEQNLVTWAQPYFREPKRFPELADPQLEGVFPERSLNQAVGVAAMCLQEEPSVRPFIFDVVAALSFLTVAPPQADHAPASASTVDSPEKSQIPSSSSNQPEENVIAASSHKYQSEDEDEQSADNAEYNEDSGSSSSSESLYNEDDYSEDESQQEETKSRLKSKPSSIKRKVAFEVEKTSVSRNPSKRSSKSFKRHLDSNLSKKNVDRISSRNNKRLDSGLSKRSVDVFKDDLSSSYSDNSDDHKFSSRRNTQSSSRRSRSIKKSESEDSDSSFGSDTGNQSSRRIVTFKSTKGK